MTLFSAPLHGDKAVIALRLTNMYYDMAYILRITNSYSMYM